MFLGNRLSVQRIESFIEKCDEYRSEMSKNGIVLSDLEIFSHVTTMQAPRFFVDVYFTAVQLKRISRGLKPKLHTARKRKMYYDIYRLYCERKGGEIKGKIDFSVLGEIISSPAPQYYITPTTARQLINRYYRNKNKSK